MRSWRIAVAMVLLGSGFGKFHVSDRGARLGVNPRTGERIQVAASRVPRFTAGSGLKSAVKGR